MKNNSDNMKISSHKSVSNIFLFIFIFTFATPLLSTVFKLIILLKLIIIVWLRNAFISKYQAKWLWIIIAGITPGLLIDMYWALQFGLTTFSGLYLSLCLIFSLLVSYVFNNPDNLLKYATVVTFLTAISVCIYLIFILLPSIINLAISYDYYGYPGYSFILQNFVLAGEKVIHRNSGFASEPGLFQVFINIAIAIYFKFRKMSTLKFIILSLGIITANSTAGLFTFAIIIFLFSNNKYRIFAILVLLLLINQVIAVVVGHYESKILSDYAFFWGA